MALDFVMLVICSIILLGHGLLILWPFLCSYFKGKYVDYKNDHQMILNDVNEQIYNLSFDFLRKTYNLTSFKARIAW